MRDADQRIALAKLDGWVFTKARRTKSDEGKVGYLEKAGDRCVVWTDGQLGGSLPPDYLNSLDAIRPLEVVAPMDYWLNLCEMTNAVATLGGVGRLRPLQWRQMGLATARQRCEALLKAHKVWVEDGGDSEEAVALAAEDLLRRNGWTPDASLTRWVDPTTGNHHSIGSAVSMQARRMHPRSRDKAKRA